MLSPSPPTDEPLQVDRQRLACPLGNVRQRRFNPQHFGHDDGDLGQVGITKDRRRVARPTRRVLALQA